MSVGKVVASQSSKLKDFILGPVGVAASLISIIIVFILNYEPVEFLSQIALFILFMAFALFIASHQLLFECTCQGFVENCAREEGMVATDFLPMKLVDAVFLIVFFIWKVAIVVLFFVRNLKYLGVASVGVVAFDLLLFYQSWKRSRHVNEIHL